MAAEAGLLALAVVLAGPTLFAPPPGPGRASGGFGTGQIEPADGERADHVRTGRLVFEWLGPWRRAGLGWRGLFRDVTRRCAPVAGDTTPGRCPQSGATGRESRHELSATGGLSTEWFAASAGLAWRTEDALGADGTTTSSTAVGPAASLRLGPADLLCLRASYRDPGPETPGEGTLRAGLEATPGSGRVFVGAAVEDPGWGLLLAGQVPLGERVGLAVSGAAHPAEPGRLILLGAGLVVGFGAD